MASVYVLARWRCCSESTPRNYASGTNAITLQINVYKHFLYKEFLRLSPNVVMCAVVGFVSDIKHDDDDDDDDDDSPTAVTHVLRDKQKNRSYRG